MTISDKEEKDDYDRCRAATVALIAEVHALEKQLPPSFSGRFAQIPNAESFAILAALCGEIGLTCSTYWLPSAETPASFVDPILASKEYDAYLTGQATTVAESLKYPSPLGLWARCFQAISKIPCDGIPLAPLLAEAGKQNQAACAPLSLPEHDYLCSAHAPLETNRLLRAKLATLLHDQRLPASGKDAIIVATWALAEKAQNILDAFPDEGPRLWSVASFLFLAMAKKTPLPLFPDQKGKPVLVDLPADRKAFAICGIPEETFEDSFPNSLVCLVNRYCTNTAAKEGRPPLLTDVISCLAGLVGEAIQQKEGLFETTSPQTHTSKQIENAPALGLLAGGENRLLHIADTTTPFGRFAQALGKRGYPLHEAPTLDTTLSRLTYETNNPAGLLPLDVQEELYPHIAPLQSNLALRNDVQMLAAMETPSLTQEELLESTIEALASALYLTKPLVPARDALEVACATIIATARTPAIYSQKINAQSLDPIEEENLIMAENVFVTMKQPTLLLEKALDAHTAKNHGSLPEAIQRANSFCLLGALTIDQWQNPLRPPIVPLEKMDFDLITSKTNQAISGGSLAVEKCPTASIIGLFRHAIEVFAKKSVVWPSLSGLAATAHLNMDLPQTAPLYLGLSEDKAPTLPPLDAALTSRRAMNDLFKDIPKEKQKLAGWFCPMFLAAAKICEIADKPAEATTAAHIYIGTMLAMAVNRPAGTGLAQSCSLPKSVLN